MHLLEISQIQGCLKELLPCLRDKYGVGRLWIVGSRREETTGPTATSI